LFSLSFKVGVMIRVHSKWLWVFWFEGLVNVITAIVCLIGPAMFLSGLLTDIPEDPFTRNIVRWYGVLLMVLSLILVGALRYGDRKLLRIVLSAYLAGDLLQVLVSIQWGVFIGWTPGVWASIGSSVVYAFCRVMYLKQKRASA
jgi:hypothetical protein